VEEAQVGAVVGRHLDGRRQDVGPRAGDQAWPDVRQALSRGDHSWRLAGSPAPATTDHRLLGHLGEENSSPPTSPGAWLGLRSKPSAPSPASSGQPGRWSSVIRARARGPRPQRPGRRAEGQRRSGRRLHARLRCGRPGGDRGWNCHDERSLVHPRLGVQQRTPSTSTRRATRGLASPPPLKTGSSPLASDAGTIASDASQRRTRRPARRARLSPGAAASWLPNSATAPSRP
jgi:hypothetical protein